MGRPESHVLGVRHVEEVATRGAGIPGHEGWRMTRRLIRMFLSEREAGLPTMRWGGSLSLVMKESKMCVRTCELTQMRNQ